MKRKRATGDSVFDEPQYQPGPFAADPSQHTADQRPAGRALNDSVWAEPDRAPQITGRPADPSRDLYARWLIEHRHATPWWESWAVTVGLALCAGPLAIATAFIGSGQSMLMLLVIVFFAPACEEMAKILAALMMVEHKPYIFRSPVQILLCTATGGFVFACIENLVYLHIYVPNPSHALVMWRWSVCIALHTGCSIIAGMGVLRIWRNTMQHLRRPGTELGVPLFITAMIIHGSYNLAAVLIENIWHPFQ